MICSYSPTSSLDAESYLEGQNNLYLGQNQVRHTVVSLYDLRLTSGSCRILSSVNMVASDSCVSNIVSLILLYYPSL